MEQMFCGTNVMWNKYCSGIKGKKDKRIKIGSNTSYCSANNELQWAFVPITIFSHRK